MESRRFISRIQTHHQIYTEPSSYMCLSWSQRGAKQTRSLCSFKSSSFILVSFHLSTRCHLFCQVPQCFTVPSAVSHQAVLRRAQVSILLKDACHRKTGTVGDAGTSEVVENMSQKCLKCGAHTVFPL